MFDQQNIDIVDDDLANEENDCLHGFRVRRRLSRAGLNSQLRRNARNKTCHDHRSRNRAHGPQNAVSCDYQSRSKKKTGACFKNKIRAESRKCADTLHRAALYAQRRIRRNTNAPAIR